jgi:hypothetical protein
MDDGPVLRLVVLATVGHVDGPRRIREKVLARIGRVDRASGPETVPEKA